MKNKADIKKTTPQNFKAADIAMTAAGTVLLAALSQIYIPMPAPFVRFTMQTFALFLIIAVLGEKKAAFAILAYILLGALGMPVFSGFKGTAALIGNTGGYILGFIFVPPLSFAGTKLFKNIAAGRVFGMLAGLIICYAFGTAWFMFLYVKNVGGIALGTALSYCVLPFILPDVIKMALALFLAERIRKLLR